jgi:hypothetical protein
MGGMRRTILAGLALTLLAAACSSDEPSPPTGPTQTSQVVAIPATSDLYAGDPQRVSLGLVLHDGRLISFGEADVSFSYVGTAAEPAEPQPGPSATATFVPTYGTPDGPGVADVTDPNEGRGVYEADGVTFDRAGFWTAEVTVDVQGLGTQTAEATLPVLDAPQIPAPGDRAPRTENLTLDSTGVPEGAIDSRATTTGEIPDPELHEWTIARAIDEGRAALVLFATPVYCVSRFCGPVTDMIQELAGRYGDRAVFIHVEIYEEFADEPGEESVVNAAALEWLQTPSGDLTEPWLYLIGGDGIILDRWASMWSQDDVEAALEDLPRMRN